MVSDARDYFDAAVRFSSADFRGAFYLPPGESLSVALALSLLGRSVLAARLVTIATDTATVAVTALVARELAGEDAAVAAAAIATFYAPAVLLSGQTYSQHLCALCVVSVAYFGMRALREQRLDLFAAAGAAMGLGCLTRPSMASLAPVLLAALVLSARRSRHGTSALAVGAVAGCVVALILVVPVQAHNAGAGAGWTISTNNERNLFLGNNPFTPDYKTSHLGQRALDELPPDVRAYLGSFYGAPAPRAAMEHAALEYIVDHPVRSAKRTIFRATSFWGFDYMASREIQKWRGWRTPMLLPVLALEAGSFIAVGALALAGLMRRSGSCDPAWRRWLLALVLAYEAPYAIAFSGATYHFPVMPLVIPFAAVALTNRDASWRRAWGSKAVIIALAVFAVVQIQSAIVAVTFGA